MTTANMKLVILDVPLDGEMESPDQKLEDGEEIVRRTVELKNLYRVLKGMSCFYWLCGFALAGFDLIIMNLSHETQRI
jgi:ADP-ribose pyrophosphatase